MGAKISEQSFYFLLCFGIKLQNIFHIFCIWQKYDLKVVVLLTCTDPVKVEQVYSSHKRSSACTKDTAKAHVQLSRTKS